MARKGRIEIGASVIIGAKEDGSLSAIEKRIEELSDKEIEIKISDATKDLKELEKMEKKVGGKVADSIAARRKERTDLIELCKQEQKLRADGLKQMNQEVKVAKELQKVEKKRIEAKEKKNSEPTKREQELIDIAKMLQGIRGAINVFDDPSIERTEERLNKLNDALDEYQVKLDAMKRLRKGNERTMYDTAKSEIADLKRALSAIQAVKDQTPTIKPKMEKKEKEVEQEKPKKTNAPTPTPVKDNSAEAIQQQASAAKQQTRNLEQVNAELKKERENLAAIEQAQNRNDAAREALQRKRTNYSGEALQSNKAVYDTDKLAAATEGLRTFNSELEKRNQFMERYKQLYRIVQGSFVGQYSISNGIYADMDQFMSGNPAMKELDSFAKNGIKGISTKHINELFTSVANSLRREASEIQRMINSGSVLGAKVIAELDQEEIRLGQEQQRLYDEREAQLTRINALHQEEMDLIAQKGREEKKNTKATEPSAASAQEQSGLKVKTLEQQTSATQILTEANNELSESYLKVQEAAKKSLDVTDGDTFATILKYYKELLKAPQDNEIVAAQKALIEKAFSGAKTPDQLNALQYVGDSDLAAMGNKLMLSASFEGEFLFGQISAYLQDIVGSTIDWGKALGDVARQVGNITIDVTQGISTTEEGVDLSSQIFDALKQIRELENKRRDSDYSNDDVKQKFATMRSINAAIADIQEKKFPYIGQAFEDEDFNPEGILVAWSTTDEILREMANSIAIYTTAAKENLGDLKLIKIDTSNAESFNGELKDICDNAGKAIDVYRGLANEVSTNGLATLEHHSGATWFSTKQDVAAGYARGSDNVYRANLRSRRLLDIDANNSAWNAITFLGDGSDEMSKKMIELYNKKKELEEELKRIYEEEQTIEAQRYKDANARLRRIAEDYSYYSKKFDNPYGTNDTNWYAQYAKENGYDAFRIRNVYDTLQGGGLSDVIGVFSQEQIANVEKVASMLQTGQVERAEEQLSIERQITTEKEKQATIQESTNSVPIVEQTESVGTATDAAAAATEQLTQGIQQVGETAQQTSQQLEQQTASNNALAESTERAAGASEQAAQRIEKQSGLLQEQTSARFEPSKLTFSETKAIFGDKIFDEIISAYNIKGQNVDKVYGLFTEMAQLVKSIIYGAENNMDISAPMNQLEECTQRTAKAIMDLGSESVEVSGSLRNFYDFMKGTKIKYNDSQKAEYSSDWTKKIGRPYRNYLTTSTSGIPADVLYQELSEEFPDLFSQDIISDIEQFVKIFEVLGEAIDAKKNNWKYKEGFDKSNLDFQDSVLSNLYELQGKMTERLYSLYDLSQAETEPPVVPIQPSVAPGIVEGAIQESTGGEKVEVPVEPVVDEEETKERLSIIERNEDKALEALRNAKDNKTNLVDLSNVYSTDDLKGQLESMAQQITDNEKIPLHVGDVKINDSIAAVTMYNEALGITYRQLYKISEAADDAGKSQLELWSESYDENYKAAQKYSEAQKKKIAKDDSWLISQASKLDTQERKYKYSGKKIDGKIALTDADETSLAEGADKTIDSLAEHIKNRIQASMGQGLTDEVRNQITNDLRILDNEIKIQQYKQYASTTMKPSELKSAKDDLEYTLQSLEAKAKKNNVFSAIEQDVISLRSQLQGVADGTQLSKFIDDLRVVKSKLNAEIAKEQTVKKEEQNYQNLINLQNRLYEAKKKLNDLEVNGKLDTAEGQQASRKVQDLQNQYDLSLKLLQNEENRKAIEDRGSELDSQLNAAKNQKQIQQYYQDVFDTVNRINDLTSQVNMLKIKDGGKGIYSDLIASLEGEKSSLLSKIDQIGADINQYFNGVFTSVGAVDSIKLPIDTLLKDTDSYGIISDFLNDIGVRASLSADQINKLTQAFYNSSKAGSDFVSKINEQFKSAEDAFNRLQQLVSSGALDAENEQYKIITNVFNRLSEMNNDPNKDKWTAEQIAGFTALSERLKEYSNALSNAAEQESKYFAGKIKSRKGVTMFGDDSGENALIKVDNIDSARQKLETFVQEYTKGQGIITSFNTAANGISKVNFSVFDEATGKIRTFTAEVGKLNNKDVFYSETSMNNLTSGTDAAMKSLESISQTITRLQDIKGAESEIERLKQLAAELRDKLIEIGSSKESSDQNTLKNIVTDADNAVKSANKLGEALLRVQRAINGESSKDFNINSVNKSIDTIDQMIARLKQIDGTESVVSKLSEQLIKIKSGLSAPDINTSDGQTKLKDVLTDTEKLIKSVNVLEKQWTKAQDAMDNGNGKNLGQINKDGDIYAQMLDKVQAAANGAQVTVTGFNNTTNTLTYTLTNADGTVTTMTAHMHNLNGAVTTQQGETKKLASGWQEFTGGIGGALKGLQQYAGRMFSVWAIVGQLKKGFSAIKEIDASLTELKKVTDETESSYRNFLNTASKTAGNIGSTVSDFTTASANFARLNI